MSRVALESVLKRFGTVRAVDSVSLEVREGELLSVVGGSGCGKTTLLRLIAGFEEPDSGAIWLGGVRVDGVPARERGIGLVFQSYALFPTLSVAENVAYPMRVRRVPRNERQAKVERLLSMVNLGELAGRFPDELSGGQQQRVALARALASEPRILLLDEPLSALDAKIRLRLRAEIRRLQQDLGITTLYVTHDQEEALSTADRIAVMEAGRIVQIGTAREIYQEPATRHVAEFIGINNLIACDSAGGRHVRHGGLDWTVGTDLPSGPVTLAIRPEDLRPGAPDGTNALPCRVDVVSFLGAIVRVSCDVDSTGSRVHADLARAEAERLDLRRAAPLLLSFAPGAARCFPAEHRGDLV